MGQASIAARFFEQARRAARDPALLWRDETISYGELLERAQDAAARLAGAPSGTVGVLAAKSPESVALILGCLLTGRAFLVASPSLPEATLAELVERAGCVRAFTDSPGDPAAGLAETTPHRAAIPAVQTSVETAVGRPVEIAPSGPRDIGFMLTTSGSTGVPKIVPLANGAVAEFARWADTTFGLGPQRRVLNYAPLNFDLCLLDIWATLAAGGCCVLVDPARATNGPALAHQITEAALHVVQAVPLLFELLMDADLVAPSVRHDAIALRQVECFKAGVLFTRTEGILPAPESTHAICAAIDEALKAKQEGIGRTILFGLSGHGNFDLAAYDSYLAGTLVDDSLDDTAVARGLASIPQLITA